MITLDPMPRVPLLLIKEQVLVAHEAHFAGGIHLFNSMSTALSNDFDVHVFTTARRGLVMHHAVTNGLLGQLKRTYDRGELISWMNSCDVHFHVAIVPERSTTQPTQEPANTSAMQHTSSSSGKSMSVYETLIAAILSVAEHYHFNCKLLLDVDSLQHVVVSNGSSSSNNPPGCSSHSSTASSTAGDTSYTCRFRKTSVQSYRQTPPPQQQQQDPLPLSTAQDLDHSPHPFMCTVVQKLKPYLRSYCISNPSCCQSHQQPNATSESSGTVLRPPSAKASKPLDLLVLVQNIHHLPFGPCGTAPRTLEVLQAWCQISGVICVSHFVQGYLDQHVLPLIGLSSRRVYVMHPAAVGVFGDGPWPDLGTEAALKVWDCCLQQQQQQLKEEEEEEQEVAQQQQQGEAPQQQQQQQRCQMRATQQQEEVAPQQQQQQEEGAAQQQQEQDATRQQQAIATQQQQGQEQELPEQAVAPQQQQQLQQLQQKPVIGILKCSREKGSDLFLALAEALPEYDFLAVCAEPERLQSTSPAAAEDSSPAAAATAASKGPKITNLTLIPPEADVIRVLRQMSVVLVPSVLHEAFGLVVLDALLHGIPVITSDAGALGEAAAGAAAAVVPIRMVEFTAATHIEAKGDLQDLAVDAEVDTERAAGNLPAEANDIQVPQMTAAAAAALASPSNAQQETLQQHNRPDQGLVAQWLASRPQCQVFPSITSGDLEPWVAAVKHAVSSRDAYLELSRRGREVAHNIVGSAEQQLSQLVNWICMKC